MVTMVVLENICTCATSATVWRGRICHARQVGIRTEETTEEIDLFLEPGNFWWVVGLKVVLETVNFPGICEAEALEAVLL
jgi:hypothetical protein